jgi:hypothetical protein
MVKRPMSSLLLTVFCVGFISTGLAKDPADYRLGDQIEEDVITPVPLMVVDPIATKAFKDKEEYRIPVIFRHHRSALVAAEAGLRDAFTLARSNFLFLVEDSFRSAQLDETQMGSDLFRRVVETFKHRNKAFPLSDAMARAWAEGSTVLPEQIAISARVHEAMEGLIRYDNLTNAPKLGSLVTLVPVKSIDETITLEEVRTRGVTEFRTNVLTMSRARLALIEKFSPVESDLAKLASRCLRENCFVEADLTRVARARHTDPLFVADNFQAGQIIARKGQLVDAKVMTALGQLQEKLMAGRLAAEIAHEREKVVQEQVQSAQIRVSNRWLVIGLIAAGGVLVVALALALRDRRETRMHSTALTNPESAQLRGAKPLPLIGATSGETADPTDSWQQRALAAEQKVEEAHAAIRAGVLAQLKEKMVTNLASQREEMLEIQRSAAAELAELDQRLNELHAPMQERLRVYETRITDLEKALAAKGDENRELIKAKIEMTRKQLETERSRSELQFN